MSEELGTSTPVSLMEMYSSQDFYDVEFIVGAQEERIKSHQLLIKSNSPVLRTMLSDRWLSRNEQNQGNQNDLQIFLSDVDMEVFRLFLKFIYFLPDWNQDVDVLTVVKALLFSDRYEIIPLHNACLKWLQKVSEFPAPEDIFFTQQIAKLFQVPRLQTMIKAYMTRNLSELMPIKGFYEEMDEQTWVDLATLDDFVMDEVELFKALVKWSSAQLTKSGSGADTSITDRRRILERILPLVRFPTMSSSDLENVVKPTGILDAAQLEEIIGQIRSSLNPRKRKLENEAPADDCPGFNSLKRKFLLGTTFSLLQSYAGNNLCKIRNGCCNNANSFWFKTNKPITLFGVGLLGPSRSDLFCDISVVLWSGIGSNEIIYKIENTDVFAKRLGVFYVYFDRPVVLKSSRFIRLRCDFSTKHIKPQKRYYRYITFDKNVRERDTQAHECVHEEENVTFICKIFQASPVAELKFRAGAM